MATVPPFVRARSSSAAVTLSLLMGINLFSFIDRYILPSELALIQREFHTSHEQMGALTTGLFFVYMLSAPVTGWLGDRFPRKPLIIASVTLWSMATLFTALVHDYWTLYIRHALVGVGEASFAVFAPAVIADFYPAHSRNRVLSIFYVTIPLGGALGYITGGQIGSVWGWRMPFLVCGLPGLVLALCYALWGREPIRGAQDNIASKTDGSVLSQLLRNPAYLCATFGIAALCFATGGIASWMPYFLHSPIGLSVANASMIAGTCTIVNGIVGTAIGGWIAQRWLRTDHRALYLLSGWSVLCTLPFSALLFFGPNHWAIPSFFAAEFFLYLNTGPVNTAVVNSVPASIRATALSVSLFCFHFFGDTFSPQIIGAIADHSSLRAGLGITLIPGALSCLILLIGARFAPRLGYGSPNE